MKGILGGFCSFENKILSLFLEIILKGKNGKGIYRKFWLVRELFWMRLEFKSL